MLTWLASGAEVVILSFLGLFLFSTLFLEEDPDVADQFLKGETVTVHLDKVKAVNSKLQLHNLLLGLQLAVDRLHLVQVHCPGLPLEVLQEGGGEEEEAQERITEIFLPK